METKEAQGGPTSLCRDPMCQTSCTYDHNNLDASILMKISKFSFIMKFSLSQKAQEKVYTDASRGHRSSNQA